MTLTDGLAIVTALGLATGGMVKLLAARKSDARVAQSGIASNHRADNQMLIDGFDKLLQQYRDTLDDNQEIIVLLRTQMDAEAIKLAACNKQNARYLKQFGPLNGA